MTLTTLVLMVLALYVAQLFLQETSTWRFDLWTIMGPRDTPPDLSVLAARLERAKDNLREALPLFLGLAMLAFANGAPDRAVPGTLVFLLARVLYVPAYASGLPVLRSLIWLTGMAGLGWMALAIA